MAPRLVIVVLALVLFGLVAVTMIGRGAPTRPDSDGAVPAGVARVEPGVRVLGKVSRFTLTDQTGQPYGTDRLQGKLWIANFIFTRCPSTCPIQTSNMTRLQEQLRKDPAWESIRLVSFSVDPEHDTPEILNLYAEKADTDTEHWRFLTGTREQIWQLSKTGFKLPVDENVPEAGVPIVHSARLVLVDRRRRIRGYYDGLTPEGLDQLNGDLKTVLAEPETPPRPAPHP